MGALERKIKSIMFFVAISYGDALRGFRLEEEGLLIVIPEKEDDEGENESLVLK